MIIINKIDKAYPFFLFLIFSTSIYFFNDLVSLGIYSLITLLVIIIFKIKPKKIFDFLKRIVFFLLLVFIFNVFFDTLFNTMMVFMKLVLVCIMTYCYSCITTVNGFSRGVEILLLPLKIFKIDSKEINIILNIALCSINKIKEDVINYKNACLVKRIPLKIDNCVTIIKLLMNREFKLVNEIEEVMIIKQINIE